MPRQVGRIKENIINLLNLNCPINTPILLGQSNIEHMKKLHSYDYDIYSDELINILDNPDYVGLMKDGSIEYVKEFKTDNDFVKVSVRIALSGNYFARTLYTLNNKRVQEYIAKGTLKKV